MVFYHTAWDDLMTNSIRISKMCFIVLIYCI